MIRRSSMKAGLSVDEFLSRYGANKEVLVDQWYTDALETLAQLVSATRTSDSVVQLRVALVEWMKLAGYLKALIPADSDPHFPGFIEQACAGWWDSVTERQIALKCGADAAYRAMPAYILAHLAFRRRDRGSALRWASLGYLADELGGNKNVGGNEVTLRFGLSVPTETLALLSKIAKSVKRERIEALPEWLFAEALHDPLGAALVAPSEVYSHHPSTVFTTAAAEFALQPGASSNKKGARLEQFAAFLVSTIPGMRPRRRLVSQGQTAEHDVVATVVGESGYPLPARATEWLIECKNWKKPVNVDQVGHFLARMQHAAATFGIIVSTSGLTDGKRKQADQFANRFRGELCLREGIVCLVIEAQELLQLGTNGTFRGLIDRKYEESRFGS